MSSLVSRWSPSYPTLLLGEGEEVSREEVARVVEEGVEEALEECSRLGLAYPGVRQDRVWLHRGQVGWGREHLWMFQVVLENGLLVKGGGGEGELLKGLRASEGELDAGLKREVDEG